jgi:hypothetical protein
MIKFNFFYHTYSFEDINTNKNLKHNNWSCGFMISLVEKKISFIHFSSNNYIHPPTSSKVSIHWKFIKHLSMFRKKNDLFMIFLHPRFSCNIHHSFVKHPCANHPFFIQNLNLSISLATHAHMFIAHAHLFT